jgi:FixJ family two-component response regulator
MTPISTLPYRMSSTPDVVHVVDDDASFCTSLSRLLAVSGFQAVVPKSANEFLNTPPPPSRGCVLLDVKMPYVDGFEVQQRLSMLGINLPIVFLTGHGDIAKGVRAIKAGAEDFLPKPVTKAALLEAIQRALAPFDEVHERHSRLGAFRSLVAELTPREREVFTWVVRGKLNKQIAHLMGTSERTIKAHRKSVMDKLKVNSVAEAVLIAERLGLVSDMPASRN